MPVKQEFNRYETEADAWAGEYRCNQPAHWHDALELIYVECGSAVLSVGAQTIRADKGDCFLIAAGQAHGISCTSGDFTALALTFDEREVTAVSGGVTLSSAKLCGDYGAAELHRLIKRELEAKGPYYQYAVKSRLTNFVIDVLRSERTHERESCTDEATLNKLLLEIDKKYEFFTFEDAASFMALSPAYFSSFFHKCMGMTFSQYVNCVKVEKAVQRLKRPGVRITDVAMSCGFNTIRNFNRVFRQCTGYTPKQMPKDYRFESGYVSVMGEA